jgi:hypothetical protein
MSSFAPSIEEEKRAGIRVTRMEYPAGLGGVKLSLEQIAQRIREGALSPKVQGAAADALLKAGFNGRGNDAGSARQRAAALLQFVRSTTLYAPDPPGTEYNKSAEAMLCLRPGLCVRVGDCDDQIVLLGSLLMGVGIPVNVVKQTFGLGDQEHVLLEAVTESGLFPLDPSSDMPAGTKAPASHEFKLDPSNPSMIGLQGVPEAEFIGVGAHPAHLRHSGVSPQGFGVLPKGVGALSLTDPSTWSAADIFIGVVTIGVVTGLAAGAWQRYHKPGKRGRR